MNNNKGDLFFEFWAEENNIRYFIGINATTGEDIYFNSTKIYQIEAISSSSIYHESIIINNNNENNIFSINHINFDFINIKEREFTTRSINYIFDENVEISDYSSFRNYLIRLKNGNYFISIILEKYSIFSIYNNFIQTTFKFTSNNMSGYQTIYIVYNGMYGFANSTSCFQTEKEYILCSFIELGELEQLSISTPNSNLQSKKSQIIANINDNAFTKLLHIKNEIGAFIFFEKDTNFPIILIKNLKDNFELQNIFTNYDNITLNANGLYTLNPGLFYSDAIKINTSKFVVILTTNDLLNFIICLFDIYDDNSSLRLRYYKIELEQLNIKISVNIRAFVFNNFFGILFYNSNSKYPGYIKFNYQKFINENKINDTTIEINLFINSTSYIFSFIENMELNNILSKKLKIINFPSESQTGIIIKSLIKIIKFQ